MDKYIFYKRKSTDSEDKQILSLKSQDLAIKESIKEFETFDILIDFEESMSAKAPGRPKFNEMCQRLEAGEAKNIICWQLNRLARNPVDGGRIIWLVQNYGVKITTPTKIYGDEDILLMYVEFAMSNQFINDLRKSSMRGVDDKLRAGNAPILAPLGYYNDVTKKQGLRDILPDTKRFVLVRKMWDLLLTGQYSPVKILVIATNEWGLRQRNGKPLSRSKVYELFRNLFYTGQYVYGGVTYQGVHKQMITLDEFDRAQKILGIRGKPRITGHEFPFTRLIKCFCGSGITAHERYRKICLNCHLKYNAQKNDYCPKCKTLAPENTWYICYYHCSKKYNPSCKEPYITSTALEAQLDKVLESITLPKDFIDWTLGQLRKSGHEEVENRQIISNQLQSAINIATRKLDNLLSKYLSDENRSGELISDEEYKNQKIALQEERRGLEERIKGMGLTQDNWLETAEKTFNFAVNARYWFNNGTKEQKRSIISAIGLNLTLDNRLLHCDLLKPFELLKEGKVLLEEEAKRFEPKNKTGRTSQMYACDIRNPLWGEWIDLLCTQLPLFKPVFTIPSF